MQERRKKGYGSIVRVCVCARARVCSPAPARACIESDEPLFARAVMFYLSTSSRLSSDVLVVPVELEEMESQDGASKAASKGGNAKNRGGGKGFGASAWSKAPYVATVASDDAGAWTSRLRAEVAAAAAQGADADAGVVIVLSAGGQVSQRRVGMPDWRPFLMQLAPSTFDKAELRRAGRAP
eukprot:4420459-Pleurochrysis_carterae.AAC.1